MTGNIIAKLLVTVFAVAFAISNIIPVNDTPFRDYLNEVAEADLEAWKELDARAVEAVGSGEGQYQTYFLALEALANKDEIDLHDFFPFVRVQDILNLERKNDVLLTYLLDQSRGKIQPGLDLRGGVALIFEIDEDSLAEDAGARESEIADALSIMQERVDAYGVAEAVVRLVGDNQIEVQIPGASTKENPELIEDLARPAKLEFRTVHRTQTPETKDDEPPIGHVLMVETDIDRETGEEIERLYFVKRKPELEGDIVKRARPQPNPNVPSRYSVGIDFTDEGGKLFTELTARMADENERTNTVGQLAIVLDGKLQSAPTVREAIYGGSAEISGQFRAREAQDLANVLNNPLKAELKLATSYEISGSIAEGAKQASITAAVVGTVLVVVFMAVVYALAGAIAVISVCVNLLLVIGTLASLGATISLPGVAALVLTIGMGVDANILIFERMREELKAGKSIKNALKAGFDKAFSAIVDANVTTLIIAIILIWLGTGPVKGFGYTLAIGIVSSIFCALVVTRLFMELAVLGKLVKTVRWFNPVDNFQFGFLKHAKKAALSAALVILFANVAGFSIRGDHVWGIDFTGGEELTVSYEQPVTATEAMQAVDTGEFAEVEIVEQSVLGTTADFMEPETYLKVQTREGEGQAVFAALQAAFPDRGLTLDEEQVISASVGAETRKSAAISVAVALLGILLYVSIRFEAGYGVGAVAATVHDVLMTIGLYVLVGGQFTAEMIAAVLMILGYSINDTIVVFDRIREELGLNPGMTLGKVIDLAINQTLGRTFLTSITTLLATVSLFLFGAGIVKDFSLVFIIGIITGTFSSIFIASPIFYWWHKGDRKHVEERHDVLPKYEWESGSKVSSAET